jgi:uncharacterized damage-inducible protein DinB
MGARRFFAHVPVEPGRPQGFLHSTDVQTLPQSCTIAVVVVQVYWSQGAKNMSETSETLAFFRQGWQNYQQQLSIALARLEPSQLALRAAPNLRSIDELARHIISVRAGWFHFQLEEGAGELSAFTTWAEPESLPRPAEELVSGLEKTWQVIQEVLGRYTLADLQSTVQDEWEGQIYTLTRGWVIWHVMEHDIHHGGELAYSLGMHGLAAPDI